MVIFLLWSSQTLTLWQWTDHMLERFTITNSFSTPVHWQMDEWMDVIWTWHPSLHPSTSYHCLSCTPGSRVAGAYPSCLGVKVGLHPGYVLKFITLDNTETQPSTNPFTPTDSLELPINLMCLPLPGWSQSNQREYTQPQEERWNFNPWCSRCERTMLHTGAPCLWIMQCVPKNDKIISKIIDRLLDYIYVTWHSQGRDCKTEGSSSPFQAAVIMLIANIFITGFFGLAYHMTGARKMQGHLPS